MSKFTVADKRSSTGERSQAAFDVCNRLALIVSQGTATVFLNRIACINVLCASWEKENAENRRPEKRKPQVVSSSSQSRKDLRNSKIDDDALCARGYLVIKDDDQLSTAVIEIESVSQRNGFAATLPNQTKDSNEVDDPPVPTPSFGNFTCGECGKEIRSLLLFEKHMKAHDGEKPGKCPICHKVFKRAKYVRMHVKMHLNMHANKKLHKCNICDKTFSMRWNLKVHLRTHGNNGKSSEVTEAEVPDGEDPGTAADLTCRECGKTVGNAYLLERHRQRHESAKPCVCAVCNKPFKCLVYLRVHEKTHGELPFECSVCGKRFTTRGNLNSHASRHTSRFVCSTCGAVLSTRRGLNEHATQHTGERPFECTTCGMRFRQKCAMQTHVSARHENDDGEYVCPTCGRRFIAATGFASHMRTHAGERTYRCRDCGRCFRTYGAMRKHERTHTGEAACQCDVCGKSFNQRASLKAHMCGHTGEKPYMCHECDARFVHSVGLKKHLESHKNDD